VPEGRDVISHVSSLYVDPKNNYGVTTGYVNFEVGKLSSVTSAEFKIRTETNRLAMAFDLDAAVRPHFALKSGSADFWANFRFNPPLAYQHGNLVFDVMIKTHNAFPDVQPDSIHERVIKGEPYTDNMDVVSELLIRCRWSKLQLASHPLLLSGNAIELSPTTEQLWPTVRAIWSLTMVGAFAKRPHPQWYPDWDFLEADWPIEDDQGAVTAVATSPTWEILDL